MGFSLVHSASNPGMEEGRELGALNSTIQNKETATLLPTGGREAASAGVLILTATEAHQTTYLTAGFVTYKGMRNQLQSFTPRCLKIYQVSQYVHAVLIVFFNIQHQSAKTISGT